MRIRRSRTTTISRHANHNLILTVGVARLQYSVFWVVGTSRWTHPIWLLYCGRFECPVMAKHDGMSSGDRLNRQVHCYSIACDAPGEKISIMHDGTTVMPLGRLGFHIN